MKSTKHIFFWLSIFVIAGILSMTSCAPIYSELQTAKTVGQGHFEVAPSYSTVSFSNEGETDGVQNELSFQGAYGISEKTDVRIRYVRVWGKGGDIGDGVDVIAIGPKFSLVKNKIAAYLPIGRAFGQEIGSDSWEFQPTLFFTMEPAKNILDITLGPKYIMTFCEDCDNLIAVNLGAGISNDLQRWAIRPEYGMLFNPGEDGWFGQFSVGFSYRFGFNKTLTVE